MDIKPILQEIMELCSLLAQAGAVQLNGRLVINAADPNSGEGLVLVITRTSRALSTDELNAAFGEPDEYTNYEEEEKPKLTLVVSNNETKH